MQRIHSPSRPLLASALLLSLVLVACERDDAERSAADPIDVQADAAKVTLRQQAERAEAAAGNAMTKAADAARAAAASVGDAAITTRVKAALAADSGLASASIGVETNGGRSVLQGKVADGGVRDRASQVAAAVEGVSAVDNRLVVTSD